MLQGGLGNQMFQVATGYTYAMENNLKYLISDSVNNDLVGVTPRKNYNDTVFKNMNTFMSRESSNGTIYREPEFIYNPIPKVSGNILLSGYFQSEKYFKDLDTSIFNLPEYPRKKNYISIHVRRTDYLNHPDIHVCTDINYFKKAVSLLPVNNDTRFIIFSDDHEYITSVFIKELKLSNTELSNLDDVSEMMLMASCEHNIISNSSFSWFGSYLNKNPNKIVIAPKKWFGNNGPNDFSTVYRNGMILL
jgi:hypothetical protein